MVDERGRILLGGSLLFTKGGSTVVARLTETGALDPAFDGDGKASVPSSPASFLGEGVTAMALDPEGRPLLLGVTGSVRRLLETGALDPGFGEEGFARVAVSESSASDLAVAPSGRIMVAGRGLVGTGQEAFLGRLRPRGTTDPSFASGGVARENYTAASADARAMTIDQAGRYLLVGSAEGPRGVGLARYLGDRGRCRGKPATLVGTPERDLLRGTGGRDVIVGLGGADRIRSFGGRDLICAGGGRDRVKGGRGNDTLLGGPGADALFGGLGNDRLFGQGGADRLVGGPGRDSIFR